MKKLMLLTWLLAIVTLASAQKSPRRHAKGTINDVKIVVDYGSPSVRGRKIWGGLEAYDKVWRAGANKNTTISFDKEVTVGGEKLAAGKYGFFIMPREGKTWIVIFNKRNADWGAYSYDQKQDALRFEVKPMAIDQSQEALLYSIEANSVDFAWENVKLSIPIE